MSVLYKGDWKRRGEPGRQHHQAVDRGLPRDVHQHEHLHGGVPGGPGRGHEGLPHRSLAPHRLHVLPEQEL